MLRVLRFVLRFRLCMFGHVYVAHARAVRFMHAFCFDMVVLVFCSSVSCSVCLALVPVSFFVLLIVSAFFWLSSSSVPLFLCGSCSHLCYPCFFWPFWGLRLPEVTCLLRIYVMHCCCRMLSYAVIDICCMPWLDVSCDVASLIGVSVIGCAWPFVFSFLGSVFVACLFLGFVFFFLFSLSLSLSLSLLFSSFPLSCFLSISVASTQKEYTAC